MLLQDLLYTLLLCFLLQIRLLEVPVQEGLIIDQSFLVVHAMFKCTLIISIPERASITYLEFVNIDIFHKRFEDDEVK
jgi:hypothetical protein